MILPVSVYNTIIIIFCLQAAVCAIMLAVKKPRSQANLLLSVLLLFFALAAFNLALFYFLVLTNHTDKIPYLQLELLFGLGPSFYLYVKSTTDIEYKVKGPRYLHFLPVLLEFFYYRTPWYRAGAIALTEQPVTAAQWLFVAEQWVGTLSASIYIIAAVRLLLGYSKWVKANFDDLNSKTLRWLMYPVIAYSSFWFLWHVIRLSDLFIFTDAYRDYYFYPMFIILSALTCWIGLKGYVKRQTDIAGFLKTRKVRATGISTLSSPGATSETGKLIRDHMEKEKSYLDIDLNLEAFAKTLGLSAKTISQSINGEFNMSFIEFVNRYRVSEFKSRLKLQSHGKLSLWGHALESGFASRSTFNAVFKKYCGLTPKAYYEQVRNDFSPE